MTGTRRGAAGRRGPGFTLVEAADGVFAGTVTPPPTATLLVLRRVSTDRM